MQEALQNSLKHSNPQHINIVVSCKEALFMKLKDDGKGFNMKNVALGNGLLNMQHRAKEAGYILNIFSNEKGTEITLEKNN